MSDMIRLTGLWKSRTQGGEAYLSGNLTPTTRLLIFPNSKKTGVKEPDYFVYLAPNTKRDQASKEQTPTREQEDFPF